MSRFWALVVATAIAIAIVAVLLAVRDTASASTEGLTYEQARLHARAMHDELCEVYTQDPQWLIDSIHERYGADPADIAFVAGLVCPFNR